MVLYFRNKFTCLKFDSWRFVLLFVFVLPFFFYCELYFLNCFYPFFELNTFFMLDSFPNYVGVNFVYFSSLFTSFILFVFFLLVLYVVFYFFNFFNSAFYVDFSIFLSIFMSFSFFVLLFLSYISPDFVYFSIFNSPFFGYFFLSWDNVGFLLMVSIFMPFIFFVGKRFAASEDGFYYGLVLLLLNVFCFYIFMVSNIYLFYIFFELLIVPMAILIVSWGSKADSKSLDAGYRFFLYAFITSLPLVYVLAIMYFDGFFDILNVSGFVIPFSVQMFIFPFLLVPLLAKLPLFPFHTWLPFAHAEASTVGSLILAAILLKISLFGLIRFVIPLCFMVLDVYRPYLEVLVLLSAFYTSFSSLVQVDLKRIIAYSSIAHMSVAFFAYLNFTVEAFDVVILYSIAHAISSSALFLMVGMLYYRTGHRNLHLYSDLITTLPIFSVFFMFFTLTNVAFPFTSGFVVEFLSFLQTAQYDYVFTFFVMASTFFVTSISYWTMVRILFNHHRARALDPVFFQKNGLSSDSNNFIQQTKYDLFKLVDLSKFDFFLLAFLAVLVMFVGIYPDFIFSISDIFKR